MNKFEQFEKIDFPKFVEEVFNASEHLYLSLPSIDEEMADALIAAKEKRASIDIKVVVDNSEEIIRNGFGDIAGLDKLLEKNIQIRQSDSNLISFIISDKIGYFLFPHSRIFIDKAKGTNAFRIDPGSIFLLKNYFFPNENKTDKFEQAAIVGDSNKHFVEAFKEMENMQTQQLQTISNFDVKKHEENKRKLKNNPPLEPDLQRKINTYTSKIQFVELKFIGGNLKSKIVQMPEDALPIKSPALKSLLQTRIKMFQDINKYPEYKYFNDFKLEFEKLRKEYLKPISCRPGKSIINVVNKAHFIDKLNKLKNESATLNKYLTTMLEKGMLDTLDILKEELKVFFKINEPDELININDLSLKERKLEYIINTITSSIKFPEITKVLEKIALTDLYYDLTWNDFKDDKLHKEFREKEIMTSDDLDSIVSLKDAYETKK